METEIDVLIAHPIATPNTTLTATLTATPTPTPTATLTATLTPTLTTTPTVNPTATPTPSHPLPPPHPPRTLESVTNGRVSVQRFADTNPRVYRTIPLSLPSDWKSEMNYSFRTREGPVFEALPTKEGMLVGLVLVSGIYTVVGGGGGGVLLLM